MAFAKELKAKQLEAINKKAVEFAEKMKERIIESAEQGYSAYRYNISNNQDDKHIFCTKEFIEKLNELFDDVKVTYKEEQKQTLIGNITYYDKYILFDWSNLEE